ncbi:MAG: prefoldin subunit beta [Candidatus Lokiarchaeota archaeon]
MSGINLNQLSEETQKKFRNLQNLQQSLEFIIQQKLQLESTLKDTELAIEELEKIEPEDVVYKSIGGIMVKSNRNTLLDEKKNQKTNYEMRVKTLKQKEDRTRNQIETISKNIQAELQTQ